MKFVTAAAMEAAADLPIIDRHVGTKWFITPRQLAAKLGKNISDDVYYCMGSVIVVPHGGHGDSA